MLKKTLAFATACLITLGNSHGYGQAAPTLPEMPEGISPVAPSESRLGPALVRIGDDRKAMQPYRVKVGDREYDFVHLLKLKPSETDNTGIKILVDFDFKHAGLLNDMKELEFIRRKIAAGEQPWAGEFKKMKESRYADPSYLQKMAIPPAIISCDFSGANDRGSIQEMRDANAAYTQALMWVFTGNDIYARNAAGILEIYANTVVRREGKNWYLLAAWTGSVFPLSAELLRSTYPEWKNSRVVGKWFNDVFLPPLHNRIAFGNREFACITAMAAIGIYNEDRAAFYEAMNHWMNYIPAYHYLPEDGPAPYLPDYWIPETTPSDAFLLKLNEAAFPKDWTPWIELSRRDWNEEKRRGKLGDDSTGMKKAVATRNPGVNWTGAPSTYLPGYTAETARDFGHVEQSFASEINAAEMAWHQGIDVYTPQTKRLTSFMETQAGLRLGQPPPESMTAKLIPYDLVSTWEIALNHYTNRMGMPLPHTEKIIQILRRTGPGGIKLPKNAGQDPMNPRLWNFPDPVPSLFASGIGESVGWISSWEALTHGNLDKR